MTGPERFRARIACLQHVPFEGPAALATWARDRGHALRAHHLYRGDALPAPSDFEWLFVLGGPMSANDEATHSWMTGEKRLLTAACEAGRAILGVCLGAQLLASALGARVHAAQAVEIGWHPVRTRVADAKGTPFEAVPASFVPFHWHGETFELPAGAVHVAETDVVPHQAFAVGELALGLQFHVEATPESVESLVRACGDEIGDGPFEQPAAAILAERHRTAAVRPVLAAILDGLTARWRRAQRST